MQDLRDFIQQVKRANDIVDVVGSYIELRSKGTSHLARCPFHGEKTPSFNVNRNMQIFKCFGCGESGDVITFVQKYESCTFMEAVEILAKRAGIPMPESANGAKDVEMSERKKKRDTYLDICKTAAVFYYKCLRAPMGAKALAYMKGRGVDDKTLSKFGIGYSPNSEMLPQYLRKAGFIDEDCLKCGVLQNSSRGVIDPMYGRVIIPVFNMQGKVIAFGGRGIDERIISMGKYKNTSDSALFSKKNNLFALNIAKEQKQQRELTNLVVVEGYMDVISMYQAGFKRAVASMGTSLTEEQAKWLSRLTDTVYICYDGDAAGQKATVRGLDILDKAGLQVMVMTVPEKLDPDEYIKKYGSQAFEKLIDEALPLPDYKLRLLDNAFPIDSPDAAKRNDALPKYVNGALAMLRRLDDTRQNGYITVVSAKTGYSEDYLRRKLAGDLAEEEQPVAEQTTDVVPTNSAPETLARYFVLSALLRNQDYATLDEKPFCKDKFLSDLFDYVISCKQKDEAPSLDMMYTVCPDATESQYSQILDIDFSVARHDKNALYYNECVKLIKAESLKSRRETILRQIKQTPSAELLAELAQISDKINALK